MVDINRASLPEEFYDVTSSRMLVQPEAQYLYAFFAKMSLGSALMIAMGAGGISPDRGIPTAGQSAQQYQQSARLLLASPDPMDRQAVATTTELGNGPGHVLRLNRPRYGSGGFTLAAREITSGSQISTTPIDIGAEQVTMTLKRYGGPYDASVQSAVAPFAIDKFDASVALHSLVDYVGLHMQRDLDVWLDTVMATFFASGSTTLWPTGYTSDNGSLAVGDMPMDMDLIFRSVETLKNAKIPRFANGRYRCVLTPTQGRQLKNDAAFQKLTAFDVAGKNPVTGTGGAFIGSLSDVDIYECSTNLSVVNANAIAVTTGVMFGPSMVGQGWGKLPRVAYSTLDNYGEDAKMVWLAYAAFNLMDSRFAVQIHTS